MDLTFILAFPKSDLEDLGSDNLDKPQTDSRVPVLSWGGDRRWPELKHSMETEFSMHC